MSSQSKRDQILFLRTTVASAITRDGLLDDLLLALDIHLLSLSVFLDWPKARKRGPTARACVQRLHHLHDAVALYDVFRLHLALWNPAGRDRRESNISPRRGTASIPRRVGRRGAGPGLHRSHEGLHPIQSRAVERGHWCLKEGRAPQHFLLRPSSFNSRQNFRSGASSPAESPAVVNRLNSPYSRSDRKSRWLSKPADCATGAD